MVVIPISNGITVDNSEIIVLGDIIIYLDVNTNPHTRRFKELLEC